MSKRFDLTREAIPLTVGNNLQAYKRDGLVLNTSPLEEYIKFTASGVEANQQAVFDLDKLGLDIMPEYLLANFVSTAGDVSFKVNYYGDIIFELTVTGANASAGFSLPRIPIANKSTKLIIAPVQACNFIWVTAKQVVVLDNIAQDYFV